MEALVVTEEPLPGWLRYEIKGQPPWFKTPVPRKVIRNAKKLTEFLEKEHCMDRMKDVGVELFSFKRRLGLKSENPRSHASFETQVEIEAESDCAPAQSKVPSKTILKRLAKNPEVLDHKKLLLQSAKDIDEFQRIDDFNTPENFRKDTAAISSSCDTRKDVKNMI